MMTVRELLRLPRTTSRMSLVFASVLALGAGAGCGDDPETIIDLTIEETLPVDFDALQGGVTEGASFQLADLREEQAYADAQGKLKCASVDARASSLKVDTLQLAAGATLVDYRVSVAPRGSDAFQEIGRFSGSIAQGDRVTLDDSKFTFSEAGMTSLSQIVLGANPALDVLVTATVPGTVDDMLITLELVLDFSSDAGGCPSLSTGL